MNEFEQQLVDEACYPFTRTSQWVARVGGVIYSVIVISLLWHLREPPQMLPLGVSALLLAFSGYELHFLRNRL